MCCSLIFEPWPPSCGVWQESGLAAWIGGHLQPLAEVPPAAAVMLITGFVACFTEFASNTATIIIFLPVIAELVRPRLDAARPARMLIGILGSICCRGGAFRPALDRVYASRGSLRLVNINCRGDSSLSCTLQLQDCLQEGSASFEHLRVSLSPSGHPRLSQPALLHDSRHNRLLLRLHAARVHAAQLHRLRLGPSHGQRHGNAWTRLLAPPLAPVPASPVDLWFLR